MRVNDVMALSLHVMSSKEIKLQRLRLLRWLSGKEHLHKDCVSQLGI